MTVRVFVVIVRLLKKNDIGQVTETTHVVNEGKYSMSAVRDFRLSPRCS